MKMKTIVIKPVRAIPRKWARRVNFYIATVYMISSFHCKILELLKSQYFPGILFLIMGIIPSNELSEKAPFGESSLVWSHC